MIGAYHPYFHEELIRRVVKESLERAEDLGNGAAGDFADYRYAVGFIAGLKLSLEIAEDIRRECDK